MKELKVTFPQEEDYFKLNAETQEKLLKEMKNVLTEVDSAVYQLIAIRLAPIFETHTEIETITLDNTYEYNDEGYAPHYIMPWINDNYDQYSSTDEFEDEWRSEIETAVAEVAPLVREQLTFDRQSILAKYRKETLDSQLETKQEVPNRFKV